PGVEHALLADELFGIALRALRERRRILPRLVVFARRRRERLAAFLAIPQRDLRVVVPQAGDRPVDRQAIDPVEDELSVPRRPELHFVCEPPEVVTEFELLQVPRIRGEEFD